MKTSWPQPTVLTYHEVLPGRPTSRYTVSCDQFDAHLRLILGCTADGAMRPIITFDDGHQSNADHALRLLDRYGMKATFFLTAGLIEKRHDFMRWSQVRELIQCGHSIGAHGWSHRFLPQCDNNDLRHELDFAKAHLEDKSGQPITEVSMPGGRFDTRVLRFASEAQYRSVYVSNPWVYDTPHPQLQVIGRAMIRNNIGLRRLKGLVEQTLITRGVIRMEQVIRSSAQFMCGDAQYHRVWAALANRSNLHSSLK